MAITALQLAGELGGALEGDGSVVIRGMAGLHDAREGDVTFLSNLKYAAAMSATKASAVVVGKNWNRTAPCTLIKVDKPDTAFIRVAELFTPDKPPASRGIHKTAVIAEDVRLGGDVSIGPYCVIEQGVIIGDRTVLGAGCYAGYRAVIGSDCMFYPGVSLREHVTVGDRVVIHNGAVIGSDGFGYVKEGGQWRKIPQVGTVEIGNDVEIGANVTIDRARFGKTVIGNGVKIDNLVQVAHNVKVGDNAAIAAQVGIAGSTTIGKNVQLAGQAGISGHLVVGEDAVVGGQAGVTKNVPAGTFVSGYPAMPHDKARRLHAHTMRLPELHDRVLQLDRKIAELEKKATEGRE